MLMCPYFHDHYGLVMLILKTVRDFRCLLLKESDLDVSLVLHKTISLKTREKYQSLEETSGIQN